MPTISDTVLAALRAHPESGAPDHKGFCDVYLDNARPAGIGPNAFAGALSALEARGLYKPVDNFAWGRVLVAGRVAA